MRNSVEVFVLSIKVTSHPPRPNYFGEVPILDWKEAGLSKPFNKRGVHILLDYLRVSLKANLNTVISVNKILLLSRKFLPSWVICFSSFAGKSFRGPELGLFSLLSICYINTPLHDKSPCGTTLRNAQ